MVTASEIVAFWRNAGYASWFTRSDAFDTELCDRFAPAHFAAARRELERWIESADGALALLVLLDQVPRNIFRDSAHAYATDPLARHYARQMLASAFDTVLDPTLRPFCYLPFEHSEDPADQELSVTLSRALGGEYLAYAVAHRDVIARFGRFPHRNRSLGRDTTPEEQAYLDAGGGF
jgi:uncharacterized protein (DUF924 family)